MSRREEFISSADGLRLFVCREETQSGQGEIVLVHGFGEHCGRYATLTNYLLAQGYSVTSYDQRGHGRSEGLRGHVDRFGDYEEDLELIVSRVTQRDAAKPVFIMGHSMGGLVALRYAAKKKNGLTGAVISAPLIDFAVKVPTLKLWAGRIAARIAPRLRFHSEFDPADLSRDPEVGRAYAADPLVNRLVSARWFAEASQAMEEIFTMVPELELPLLVMHGTQDRLARQEATKRLFARIGSVDKELVLYPDYFHELFNEPEKERVFEKVSNWLEGRCT